MTCIGALTAVSSEHMDSTPQEVFDSMRGNFQASKAKGVHARINGISAARRAGNGGLT